MACEYENIFDKLEEECGVFGIWSQGEDNLDVARMTYYGLYALQHRGQESCGMAVNDNGTILHHKDMGLVPDVFNDVVIRHLKGKSAIGHARYSTTGASLRENAQPMVSRYRKGQLALAHNGNLVNAGVLRDQMENDGVIFQTTIDSEVILNLIARHRVSAGSTDEAIIATMKDIQGAYALTILTPKRLIGVRDPLGMRPLCIGKIGESFVLASETCALDAVGAVYVRDVQPGEVVSIDDGGLTVVREGSTENTKLCSFEYIYFARPDSFIDGASVHQARLEAGKYLAQQHPVDADIVIGVPDSGLTAAMGYAQASGIPYSEGFIKNRYVGRTFIQPDQGQRETGVRIKLNALRNAVEGRRVIMIDDSIVRGTTSRRIVQILRDAGATEVHMRVSSPPVKYSCYFGIDTPSRQHLVASSHSVEEIRDIVGADSLGFLSVENLMKTPLGVTCGLCNACFTGEYPMVVPEDGTKFSCGG